MYVCWNEKLEVLCMWNFGVSLFFHCWLRFVLLSRLLFYPQPVNVWADKLATDLTRTAQWHKSGQHLSGQRKSYNRSISVCASEHIPTHFYEREQNWALVLILEIQLPGKQKEPHSLHILGCVYLGMCFQWQKFPKIGVDLPVLFNIIGFRTRSLVRT